MQESEASRRRYHKQYEHLITNDMSTQTIDNEKIYTVFVGGTEVNDYYLSQEEANQLAEEYREDGYTDVEIVKV